MAGGLPHPVLLVQELAEVIGLTKVYHALGVTGDSAHITYALFASLLLITLGLMVRSRLSMENPGGLQSCFEVIIGGLENFVVANIGEDGRKVFPVLAGLFLFIVVGNLQGLIPGLDSPTNNVNTNAAMALFVFAYYNFWGLKNWGLGYIKHFLGPFWWLAWLMFPIEVVSHLARPLSLTLRLFGNVRGEEIVLMLMFMLAPILGTLPMYFLFSLADVIQAFVFFMLTMIYLKGSFDHAH